MDNAAREAPDPGSSDSPAPPRMRLTCANCGWTVHQRAEVAASQAIGHSRATGHAISYRGIVQQNLTRRPS